MQAVNTIVEMEHESAKYVPCWCTKLIFTGFLISNVIFVVCLFYRSV